MARTLPPAISSALADTGAQPSVSLTSQDLQRRVNTFATLIQAARTAALLTSANTILRAEITQGTDPNPVKIYRITTPTTPSQWNAAAVATLSTNGHAASGIALVQTGSTIRCFWCDNTAKTILSSDSTNDGITWSAPATVQTIPAGGYTECTGIAAASTTDVFSAWYVFPQAASTIVRSQFTSSWSAWASVGPSSPTWGQVRGIAIDAHATTRVWLAGVQMRAQKSGIAAASTTLNGTTWTPFTNLQPMDTATNGLSHPYPTIHYDASSALTYATIPLVDDGTISGNPQTRVTIWASTDGLSWQLIQGLSANFQYEVHTIVTGGNTYHFDGRTCYQIPAASPALDLAADLLSLHIHEQPSKPAQFTIVLANDQGQYLGQPQLTDNATVTIGLGYNGTTIPTHTCYIDSLLYTCAGTRQTLTIRGRDLLKMLDQVCPVYTAFTSSAIYATAATICKKANVPIGPNPGTSQFSQVLPSFSIVPGQTWLAGMLRLANTYDFSLQSDVTPQVLLKERQASDPSTWSYDQEHLGLAWQQNADQPNVIRVVGAVPSGGATNVFAEVTDQANLHSSGLHRYQHIVDRLLTTSAHCLLKAQLALRDDQTQDQTGSLTVSINPTHELLDVIDITEPGLALAAQPARINEIRTTIDFQRGTWLQQLGLELA